MNEKESVVSRCYDLLTYIVPRLAKFPRTQKFVLADRIQNALTDLLELLITAWYARGEAKKTALQKANLDLEKLRCGAYVRYVDDFAVFGHDIAHLQCVKHEIEVFLQNFRLVLHERKSRIHRTADGVTFLGYRIFPRFRLLPSANVRRFRQRAHRKIALFHAGKITLHEFHQSMNGWQGHALQADTWRLRRKLRKEIWGF